MGRKATKQKDTKERLLDAGEQFFARDGYHCTSLRTLTKGAQVNLAAVNYHFGSKEGLLRAVIKRRLVPLNQVRTKRLQEVKEKARQEMRRPEPGEVLRAFIEPTFAFKDSGPGARNFITLIGRAFSEPDDTVRTIFMELIDPLFHLFSDILAESLPDLPKAVFRWRLHFIIGAMAHTLLGATASHIRRESDMPSPAPAKLVDMFVAFVTAGIQAPLL